MPVFGETLFRECETADEAKRLASDEMFATGGLVFPVTWFVQGGRNHLAFALTLRDIVQLARRNSAIRGADPRHSTNRPLVVDHAKAIEDYLVANASSHYILPALTLTAGSEMSVYAIKSGSKIRAGYLVLPRDVTFYVTDGQHRLVALGGDQATAKRLQGALNRAPDLAGDAVAVDLVLERNSEQIHQDFADAAQTLRMPPSMLAAFNQREPFNRVLNQLSLRAGLLVGRIDMSSSTLSKGSQKLFLLNQVRGFLKELVIGDYAASEITVARAEREQLATREEQDEWIDRGTQLLDYLADRMKPWPQIKGMKPGAPESNKVAKLREEYLNLTATGLNLIGRVGHVLFEDLGNDATARQRYLDRLANLDWKKDAPMWQGNVIALGTGTAKVATNRAPVAAAYAKILESVGYSPSTKG